MTEFKGSSSIFRVLSLSRSLPSLSFCVLTLVLDSLFPCGRKIYYGACSLCNLSAIIPVKEKDSLCPSIHLFHVKKASHCSSWDHVHICKPIIAKEVDLCLARVVSLLLYLRVWRVGEEEGSLRECTRDMWGLWNVLSERKNWCRYWQKQKEGMLGLEKKEGRKGRGEKRQGQGTLLQCFWRQKQGVTASLGMWQKMWFVLRVRTPGSLWLSPQEWNTFRDSGYISKLFSPLCTGATMKGEANWNCWLEKWQKTKKKEKN